jgi:hypothetical protein
MNFPGGPYQGILRKSSAFGVVAKIFSKNIVIPSREIPFLARLPNGFGDYHQIWFLWISLDDLNN